MFYFSYNKKEIKNNNSQATLLVKEITQMKPMAEIWIIKLKYDVQNIDYNKYLIGISFLLQKR